MKSRLPTDQEIAELLNFRSRLSGDGFKPVKSLHGGPSADGKTITIPWPDYQEVVEEFFEAASRECWCDFEFVPVDAGRMLADHSFVNSADLAHIKTMLTYCVQGERFGAGYWGKMIEEGHIERLLRRLAGILDGNV